MGILQKQGIQNTILSYIGVGLGVINLIFLYPFYFLEEEIGLIRIVLSVSLLYAHASFFGLNSVILRYFPHFQSANDNRHRGFVLGVLLFAVLGFILATIIFLLLRPLITAVYLENSPLFVAYYHYLIPLTLFVFISNITESLLRSVLDTVFSLFCREVLIRLLTTAGILMVAAGMIDFEVFMIWLLGVYAFAATILVGYSVYRRYFSMAYDTGDLFEWRRLKVIFRYGLISFLTGTTTFIVQSIDSLMLGAWLSLEAVGIYSIAFFMGSVVAMPARGLNRIASPLVAAAWKRNDTRRILHLWASTSYLQFLSGLLVLGVIIVNLESIFTFLPESFAQGTIVVVLIGVGYLIDITGGLNTNILATSRKYTVELYFNGLFVAAIVATNYYLIPAYGLTGAAVASMLSYLFINLVRSVYLIVVFGMQPFTWWYLYSGVLIGGLIWAWNLFVTPLIDWHVLVDIVVNSVLFAAAAGTLVYVSGTWGRVRHYLNLFKEPHE
jgi:O-antigen/teichoic acid export membrane protein